MKNAIKLLGIIALTAVIGFSMVTCGEEPSGGGSGSGPDAAIYAGTKGDTTYSLIITKSATKPATPSSGSGNSALNGTWVNSKDNEKLLLNSGNFTLSYGNVEIIKGTYSTSGKNLTLTPTQVTGAAFDIFAEEGITEVLGLSSSKWYTKEQLKTAIIQTFRNAGYTQSQAEAEYNKEVAGNVNQLFAPQTGPYTQSDNTLTVTAWGDTSTFTKSKSASNSVAYTDSARAITPAKGYSYELTVGTKTSTGSVDAVNGSTLTLKPSGATQTFTAKTQGDNGLTDVIGLVTYDDGETDTLNVTLDPGAVIKGTGWPPNMYLSQVGLSGLRQPGGATDIEWAFTLDFWGLSTGTVVLGIDIKGNTSTRNSLDNSLKSKSMTATSMSDDKDIFHYMYMTMPLSGDAYYSFQLLWFNSDGYGELIAQTGSTNR